MKEEIISLDINPVFGALTRPAMTAGVTLEYHILNLVISMCAFIGFGNILYGLMFFPLHIFGWAVCKYDGHFFSVAYKRFFLLPQMPNRKIWGVRTYEPS